MNNPRICAVIPDNNLEAIKGVESLVDLFEVRIDLIGDGWREVVKHLGRPWIACNRVASEGGSWRGSESERIEELLGAVGLGADIVDIELETGNLQGITEFIKKRAKCLLSYHDFKGTPSIDIMEEIIQRQLAAGADICKLVTTAQKFEDNVTVLQLISEFPNGRVIAFAMGPPGYASRVLCPLTGGDLTYASIAEGKESASGQISVRDLRKIYGMLSDGK